MPQCCALLLSVQQSQDVAGKMTQQGCQRSCHLVCQCQFHLHVGSLDNTCRLPRWCFKEDREWLEPVSGTCHNPLDTGPGGVRTHLMS
ncbi:hypothetical protein CORC01_11622 [Colletotrichum orchidophilum]|uniref:Uncharacterized protein n=1 Tax=Colletotrichum orchidophilum TaxID=1209926 RepID=A0A1G4AVD6_9PEZI|nr:uncharacterized protein CORC01_11622 [Colletotrichum orchidophilum]OHE93065.1 hypothetical protein CORC01_11622 [Colletotrichum orchidophilum]